MCDRIAAACYPLLARETLLELVRLEHVAPEPFRIHTYAHENADFLIESWHAYEEPCRDLLETLRRIGKNNDIQAESISRRTPINGGRAFQSTVLYLSSSTTGTVSSQDVAQLEALHILFLERLEKLKDDLRDQPNSTRAAINTITQLATTRRISMDSSGAVVLDETAMEALVNSHAVLVNETWKMFRQIIVGFSRLRSLASLGDGPLPDEWDRNDTVGQDGSTGTDK
ncbi:hypothetical protein PINS_up006076 [Pythium insidiosum]|nr:hypothetical protein PINS_up006076 [Pythium insidiosum]